MQHEVESFLELCACTTGGALADLVEVINVSKDNESSTFPLVQCRAKVMIPVGTLKLFPHGGVLAAESAVSQREPVEAKLKGLAECYMKCVQLRAAVARKTRDTEAPYRQDFFLYNPFSEKGLVETSASGSKECGYVAPFWAVMLTGRDQGHAVNMHPYIENYKLPSPIANTFPLVFNVNLVVTLPFLSNRTALRPGELLMLPYDGGCVEIFSVPPSLQLSEF